MTSSPEDDTIVVQADPAGVRILAEHLRRRCEKAGVEFAAVFDIELAVVEAANNVVDHGYVGVEKGEIGISVVAGDGTVKVVLTDSGIAAPDGFFEGGEIPDPLSPRGRGAGIIQACIDDASYVSQAGKNRLVLTKRYSLPA